MGKAKRLKLLGKKLEDQAINPQQKKLSLLKYIVLILIIGIFVYWKIFSNGFVWDDQWQIIDAKDSLVVKNIPQLFTNGIVFTYRPLFFLNLTIINSFFGLQPFFFHALNIALHLTNTILLFIIFRHFFAKKLAFIISIFFLIHPMNVEPTANISFMMEPLYVFFGFVSLIIFMSSKTSHLPKLILGSFFLLLSLLSKESGFIFIPIILAYFAIFQRKDFTKVALSFLFIFCIYLFMRLGVAGSPIIKHYSVLPYEPIHRLSLLERLLNIPAIFGYYISTFFFPIKLAVQQYWVVKNISFTNFYFLLSFLLLAIVGTITLAKKLYHGNRNLYRIYLFFLLWLVFGLAFHFQILPLTMTVADRWFYLPMAGLLGIIACIMCMIPSDINKRVSSPYFMTIIVIIIALLSVRSIIRTYDWQDNYVLYSHDLKVLPDNYSLHNDIGAELLKMDKDEEAKKHIESSIELAPDWWLNWTNLATYYKKQIDYDKAKVAYEEAIANGKYKKAYIFYAKMYLYDAAPGSTESAILVAKRGLNEYPKSPDLWEILALSNYQLGNKKEAAKAAGHAFMLTKNPTYQTMQTAILQGVKFDISQ